MWNLLSEKRKNSDSLSMFNSKVTHVSLTGN